MGELKEIEGDRAYVSIRAQNRSHYIMTIDAYTPVCGLPIRLSFAENELTNIGK